MKKNGPRPSKVGSMRRKKTKRKWNVENKKGRWY